MTRLMKRKLLFLLCLCLLALLLTGCDEILSVVTSDSNGKKVVNNYISMIGDTVYDENATIQSWNKAEFSENIDMDNLVFYIENKKENIVVLGDEDTALEIKIFDGGYKYTIFASSESLNKMFE